MVLLVVFHELNYDHLDMQDRSLAMEARESLNQAKADEADQISRTLLRNCERDTLAMVEICRLSAAQD